MDFVSDAQRRAVFANRGEYKKKKPWKIKTAGSKKNTRVLGLSEHNFNEQIKKRTGNAIHAKGAYDHSSDEIIINLDAAKSKEDLSHTLLHEIGHRELRTYDEARAEKYAQEHDISFLQDDKTRSMLKDIYGDAPGIELLGDTVKIHEYIYKKQIGGTSPMEDKAFISEVKTWSNEVEKEVSGEGIISEEQLQKQLYPLKNAELLGPENTMYAYDSSRHKIHTNLRQHPNKQEKIFGLDMIAAWENIDQLVERDLKNKGKTRSISLLMEQNPNNVMAAPKDARNYKFRVENHVIGAGTRVAIAKELPDKVDLSLENVTDERGEHVVVHVKGRESDVEEYRNKVVDLKNSNKLGKAADYGISKIEEDTVQDLDTGRTFNKLECEQMSTFVDTSLELRDVNINGFAGLHQDMKLLPGEIAKAIKGS